MIKRISQVRRGINRWPIDVVVVFVVVVVVVVVILALHKIDMATCEISVTFNWISESTRDIEGGAAP